jgi:hypothetical protein
MLLCFVAGLCSIPNMIYFAGADYSGGQEGVNPWLASSAICTDTTWVPCPSCAGLSREELPSDRLAYVTKIGLNLTFALRNNCEGTTRQSGMIHYATLLVVFFGLFVLNRYLMKMEAIFDSDVSRIALGCFRLHVFCHSLIHIGLSMPYRNKQHKDIPLSLRIRKSTSHYSSLLYKAMLAYLLLHM